LSQAAASGIRCGSLALWYRFYPIIASVSVA